MSFLGSGQPLMSCGYPLPRPEPFLAQGSFLKTSGFAVSAFLETVVKDVGLVDASIRCLKFSALRSQNFEPSHLDDKKVP